MKAIVTAMIAVLLPLCVQAEIRVEDYGYETALVEDYIPLKGPQVIPCQDGGIKGKIKAYNCFLPNIPKTFKMVKEGGEVKEYQSVVVVICDNSSAVCQTQNDEYAGKTDKPGFYYVQQGYYLSGWFAYRFGYGPEYGGRDIAAENPNAAVPHLPTVALGRVVQIGNALPSYEGWCNPRLDDDCYLNNKKIPKADLVKYLPVLDCDNDSRIDLTEPVLCFDKKGKAVALNQRAFKK